jgi:hypothetical protein
MNEMQIMIEMLQLNTLLNSHEHMVTWTFLVLIKEIFKPGNISIEDGGHVECFYKILFSA